MDVYNCFYLAHFFAFQFQSTHKTAKMGILFQFFSFTAFTSLFSFDFSAEYHVYNGDETGEPPHRRSQPLG